METLQFQIQEINRLDGMARASAIDAVEYARQAGMLLLDVKRNLKHGQFLKFLKSGLTVSPRQAQRYMAVAEGKSVAVRQLADKSDTVSHLNTVSKQSTGLLVDGVWVPERSFSYLFNDSIGAAYWVTPGPENQFHVCKHFNGDRISSEGFYWRYTIFADITDPDLTSEHYIGTRFPIFDRGGISGILESYGLKDVEGSLVLGHHYDHTDERPFGEPNPENWYWDSSEPDDGLYLHLKSTSWLNRRGAITFVGTK